MSRKLCLGTLRGGSGPCEWGGLGRLRIEEDGERMTNQMAGTGSMADEAGAPALSVEARQRPT